MRDETSSGGGPRTDAGVTYRGQSYRRVGTKSHVRRDGKVTQLAVWQSTCPVCGEAFEFFSSRTTRLREPSRRCPKHRAPGRRVVFEGG
jgi:hypothetical protein